MRVQAYKKGPDYIDPLWLSAATGLPCRNLDFYTMEGREIDGEFTRHLVNADIGLIEGNKGLHDGMDLAGRDSNAALARRLNAPVVLVVDCRGMTRGVAPLLLGNQEFDKKVNIAGTVLNRVGGARHEGKLRNVIETYTDIPVLGAVPADPGIEIKERHLGLIPSNEVSDARHAIERLAGCVEANVDVAGLIEIASSAQAGPPLTNGGVSTTERTADVRIGLPRDRAFGFYYPGDLEALAAAGAEIVPFDTLSSSALPDVDGLFLGGGFPEMAMAGLEANRSLRAAIKRFIESGGPAYAECGGLMYLARSLRWGEKKSQMVGVLDADVVMTPKPQGRGYGQLVETADHPWGGGSADPFPVHEFHYSHLENFGGSPVFAYRVNRGAGVDGQHDGIVYKNLLASYTHLRDTGRCRWAERFVNFVRKRKKEG